MMVAKKIRTLLYGKDASRLKPELEEHRVFELVESDPEVVVCYGGDGTLLAAELAWPGVPKTPIRNSRRGARCIDHPPEAVIARLASGELARTEFIKLACEYRPRGGGPAIECPTAMNEYNVHMGRINSAVRFTMHVDEEAIQGGEEIIGDGFVVSTPFGSTAYFRHITRGIFYTGLGIAFKLTAEYMNHLIVPESAVIRAKITRGPALLGLDNYPRNYALEEGDELIIRKHDVSATILTWEAMSHPTDQF